MSRDEATLLDILRAARLARDFAGDIDKAEFLEDAKTQSAVLHQVMVLGEAVKRMSEDFRVRHQEVAWKAIAGARDKLIHEYDDVDLDEVWKMVRADIPELIEAMERFSPGSSS